MIRWLPYRGMLAAQTKWINNLGIAPSVLGNGRRRRKKLVRNDKTCFAERELS